VSDAAINLIAGLPPLDNGTATDVASLIVLCTLVEYLRPTHIVEAGTYKGHFAVGAARVSPASRVDTWDTVDWGWDKALAPNVEFHLGDFDPPHGFDFAFVDSGPPFLRHTGDSPLLTYDENAVRIRHWRLACERVAPGGLVICHDTNATDWIGATEIVEQGTPLRGGLGLTLWSKPL